jgi:ChpA-C
VRAAARGVRLAAWCGIAVAGLALALNGQGAAQAATAAPARTAAQAATAGTVGPAGTTSGNGSVGSGNQLILPITVPIDICGNVVAALGLGQAQCTGGSTVASSAQGKQGKGTGRTDQAGMNGWSGTQMAGSQAAARTSGNGGVLSGNQILVPVTVPVTVCGVAVGVLGTASGNCQSTPCHCHRASQPKPQPTRVRLSAPAPHPEAAIHPEAIPEAGILPITGVNLAGMTGGAVILLAAGGGTLLVARRRH